MDSYTSNIFFYLFEKNFVNDDIEYTISEDTKSRKLNLLQVLILSSNDIIVKNFLKNNMILFKDVINYQNDAGWTALMMACANSNRYSNNEIVKLLLDQDADPNIQDKYGYTALMLSCENSNTDSNNETVILLLDHKADPNLENDCGWTALMFSCCNTNTTSNIETVKLLLNYKSDTTLQNNCDGYTALMLSCVKSNTSSNIETVKLLLNNGKDINILNEHTETALMLACLNEDTNIETVKLLLENGADINIQDGSGLTILMLSCTKSNKNYNEEFIKLLLDYDPCFNIYCYYMNFNALMYLCNELPNKNEMVKLIKSKTNLFHRTYNNELITDVCLNEYKYLFKKF